MGLRKSNPILSLDQLDIENNISLTKIFHIKALTQEYLDLVDYIKTSAKDQYVIDIQTQYNSLAPS
jgi:hypothetical protein